MRSRCCSDAKHRGAVFQALAVASECCLWESNPFAKLLARHLYYTFLLHHDINALWSNPQGNPVVLPAGKDLDAFLRA